MLQDFARRHTPRARPGTGPTSKLDVTLRAEMAQLNAEMTRLVKDQRAQFQRIAELQHELDEVKRLLKALQRNA
jgi:hypothetical protein